MYQESTGALFDSEVKGLKGEATLGWSAIGVGSALDLDAPAFSLPFSIPIPIEVGPLPFVLTVKSSLRFAPALTSQSSSGGSFKVDYDSEFGFSFNGPKVDPVATVWDAVAALGDKETVTAAFGPVGFGGGWEFPRASPVRVPSRTSPWTRTWRGSSLPVPR